MSDEAPRLYLSTPPLTDVPPALGAALDAGNAASLLLRLGVAGEAAERLIRAVAPIVQDRGVALVLDGEPDLALRLGADGAQAAGDEGSLDAALKKLAPGHIVGAGGLATRHAAMRAGEAGADYVLFGDAPDGEAPPALDVVVEQTRWWAELFTTPCVALAQSLSDVEALAAAGADFIMLGDWVWSDPRGPAAAVADAAARLAKAPAP